MNKEIRCPELRVTNEYEVNSLCQLNWKACIRESNGACLEYERFLKEHSDETVH
jgi:hypothetical protein